MTVSTDHSEASEQEVETDDSIVEPEPLGSKDATSADETGQFFRWLNKQQWVALVAFLIGVGVLFFDTEIGFKILAGSMIAAGLFPVVTGYYRSPFGVLRGWQARVRGLFSVGIGVMVLALVVY